MKDFLASAVAVGAARRLRHCGIGAAVRLAVDSVALDAFQCQSRHRLLLAPLARAA
jgi:hypothetical protein